MKEYKILNRVLGNIGGQVLLALILFIAAFMFFYGLSYPSVRMWDESRLAVNALEMLDNGQWFVTYYDGEPDMWNTKPPLMIWLISMCMFLLGVDTLALRLPSAIAGIATVGIIILFCTYYLRTFQAGLLTAIVLITSSGYVGEHVTRTGDYDAILVLWITVYSLALLIHFNNLAHKSGHPIYLWSAGVAFVLAIWTKGIAGALVLPGIFLYLATQPKLMAKIFRSPHTYYVALFCLLLSLLPYLIREFQNPGYIQAVMANEIFGRYSDVVENHAAPAGFYIEGLFDKYVPWIHLWLPCCIITSTSKNTLFRTYGRFSLLYLIAFVAILSLAKTKLPWYDAPIYPIASISIGLGIHQIHHLLYCHRHNWHHLNLHFKKGIKISPVSLSLILLLCVPCINVAYNHIYKNHGILYPWSHVNEPTLQYGGYFKELSLERPIIKDFAVPLKQDEYNAHLLFYAEAYNRKGYNIHLEEYDLDRLSQGTIVTCDQKLHDEITHSKTFKQVHHNDYCSTFVAQ